MLRPESERNDDVSRYDSKWNLAGAFHNAWPVLHGIVDVGKSLADRPRKPNLRIVAGASIAIVIAMLAGRAVAFDAGLIVVEDRGGLVLRYMKQIDALNERKVQISIIGDCRSACTLYLGADRVCVSRDAVLRFHGPRSFNGDPLPDAQFDLMSSIMADYYPEPIEEWFMETARYMMQGTIPISGEKLIEYGVPECGE